MGNKMNGQRPMHHAQPQNTSGTETHYEKTFELGDETGITEIKSSAVQKI